MEIILGPLLHHYTASAYGHSPLQEGWHSLAGTAPRSVQVQSRRILAGFRYYQDGRRSPNEAEREDLGYSLAWMHHKGRNRHHFEYWNDYNPKTKRMEPVEMPVRFLAEMFCDRVAASKIYLKEKYQPDEPLHYFQNSTAQKRGLLHPSTAKALTDLLTILAEEGEDRAFSVLRQMVKSDAHSRKSR